VTLEANLDAGALAARGPITEGTAAECAIFDAEGSLIAGESASRTSATESDGAPFAAESTLQAAGWAARAPWRLRCVRTNTPAAALLDPLASRYRLTLILNLVVMGLALLLGSFAIQQARRRESLEARAQEEMRVRELERQLFHAERLSTVGRLAAGIAHEINNPLEGMSNYLGLAREAIARGDSAAAEKRLEGVREGLERAAGIVQQVLAHADPATTPRSRIELNPLLAQSVAFVRTRKEFEKIRLDLDLAEEPATVRGNPTTLGQLFLNLILNACEAQPRGGEVVIRSRPDGGRIVVEIADRGPGIPPEDLPRIFEPFFSTKQSTGLGLSICWSIVQSHEGVILVAPRSGGGAVFRIDFPVGGAADA